MEPSLEQLTTAITNATIHELDGAVNKITHCLDQLSEEMVWWRPTESMNSIANLILHLCGNVRQWIIAGVGGVEDNRNRPQEFSERSPIPKQELLQRLNTTVAEAKTTLENVAAANLLHTRRIQGFDVTGIAAIFDSVSHFKGHTQEIIHMTRCQLGDKYRFDFVPKTPEEMAG